MSGWIITYTGRKFSPSEPKAQDISMVDIAHSLSFLCRYNGHCTPFYSVAEHSVRLCDIVPEPMKPLALMHDAAEAYLGDMNPVLKDLFPGYRRVESRVLKVILDKYNVTRFFHTGVKRAENKLLATEVRDLKSNTPNIEEWDLTEEPLEEKIVPWSPELVEKRFLTYFYMCVGEGWGD